MIRLDHERISLRAHARALNMHIDQHTITISLLNDEIDNLKKEVQTAVTRQVTAQQKAAQCLGRELQLVSSQLALLRNHVLLHAASLAPQPCAIAVF